MVSCIPSSGEKCLSSGQGDRGSPVRKARGIQRRREAMFCASRLKIEGASPGRRSRSFLRRCLWIATTLRTHQACVPARPRQAALQPHHNWELGTGDCLASEALAKVGILPARTSTKPIDRLRRSPIKTGNWEPGTGDAFSLPTPLAEVRTQPCPSRCPHGTPDVSDELPS